jgi:hypothetical protein
MRYAAAAALLCACGGTDPTHAMLEADAQADAQASREPRNDGGSTTIEPPSMPTGSASATTPPMADPHDGAPSIDAPVEPEPAAECEDGAKRCNGSLEVCSDGEWVPRARCDCVESLAGEEVLGGARCLECLNTPDGTVRCAGSASSQCQDGQWVRCIGPPDARSDTPPEVMCTVVWPLRWADGEWQQVVETGLPAANTCP